MEYSHTIDTTPISGTNTGTTKIIIHHTGERIARNLTSDTAYGIKPIDIEKPGEMACSYFSQSNFGDIADIQVSLQDLIAGKNIAIDLPEKMRLRLSEYLSHEEQLQKENAIFDCISFAHYINSVSHTSRVFRDDYWDISELENENALQPGDSLFISDREEYYEITHFSVYLGHGLYISKAGMTGRLIVSDLENMIRGFGGKYLYRATPKKK